MRWLDGITDSLDMGLGGLRHYIIIKGLIQHEGKKVLNVCASSMYHVCILNYSVVPDFLQPHRLQTNGSSVCGIFKARVLQSTRLPCPRNSAGKETGVGCHFLLQYISPSRNIRLQIFQVKKQHSPGQITFQATKQASIHLRRLKSHQAFFPK